MEQKYFYFGVRKQKSIASATSSTRNVETIIWGRNAYPTREAAIRANIEWWCKHDYDPIVRGFDKQLDTQQDGTAKGFKQ